MGGVHGLAQIITRIVDKKTRFFSEDNSKLLMITQWTLTFVFINLTWVLFRSNSVGQAMEFYQHLFSFKGIIPEKELLKNLYPSIFNFLIPYIPHSSSFIGFLMLAVGTTSTVLFKNTNQKMTCFTCNIKTGIIYGLLMSVCILSLAGVSSFLYWNF